MLNDVYPSLNKASMQQKCATLFHFYIFWNSVYQKHLFRLIVI